MKRYKLKRTFNTTIVLKKVVPTKSINNMLSVIDYETLIKNDANTECESFHKNSNLKETLHEQSYSLAKRRKKGSREFK